MERKFKQMIFLGAGEHSVKMMDALHDRVEEGFNWRSLGQQGSMDEEIETNIRCIVSDIIAAFGYDPSDMKWRYLPYPHKGD